VNEGLKTMGHFILITLFSIHVGFFFLLLSPTALLFKMNHGDLPLVEASLIPNAVQDYLRSQSKTLSITKSEASGVSSQLKAKFLEFRSEKFLDETEQLALNLSVVNFGPDIVGLEAGAGHYFQKPLSDLTEDQWMSLIYFQAIFN